MACATFEFFCWRKDMWTFYLTLAFGIQIKNIKIYAFPIGGPFLTLHRISHTYYHSRHHFKDIHPSNVHALLKLWNKLICKHPPHDNTNLLSLFCHQCQQCLVCSNVEKNHDLQLGCSHFLGAMKLTSLTYLSSTTWTVTKNVLTLESFCSLCFTHNNNQMHAIVA